MARGLLHILTHQSTDHLLRLLSNCPALIHRHVISKSSVWQPTYVSWCIARRALFPVPPPQPRLYHGSPELAADAVDTSSTSSFRRHKRAAKAIYRRRVSSALAMPSNKSSHSGRGSSPNGAAGNKGREKGKGPAKVAKKKVPASTGKGKKSKVHDKGDDHAGSRTTPDNTTAPLPVIDFRLAASLLLVQYVPGAPQLTTPRLLGSSSKDSLPPPTGFLALLTGTVTPYPAADPAARRAMRSSAAQLLTRLGAYAPPIEDADLDYSDDSNSGSSDSPGSGSDGDCESGVESGSDKEEEDEAPDEKEKEEEEGNDKDGEDDKYHEDDEGTKDDKGNQDDNGKDDDMGSKGGGRGGGGGASGGDAVDSDLESDIGEPDAGYDAGHDGGQGNNGGGSYTRSRTSVGNDMMSSAYHHHIDGGLLDHVGSIQGAYQAGVAWADDRRRRMFAKGAEAEPDVMNCPLRSPLPPIPCDAPVRTNPLIGNDGSDLLHPYVADGWLSVGGAAWQAPPAYTMPSYYSDWTTIHFNALKPEPHIAGTPMPPSTRWMHQVGLPLLCVEPSVELVAVPPPTTAVSGSKHAVVAAVAATVVQQQGWGVASNAHNGATTAMEGVMVSAPPLLNLGASAHGAMAAATAAAVDGAQEGTHMHDGSMGYAGGSSAPPKPLSTTPRPSRLPHPTPTTSAMTVEWAAPTGTGPGTELCQ